MPGEAVILIRRSTSSAYLALALVGATPQIIILVSPLILGWCVRAVHLSAQSAALVVASEFAGLTVIAFAASQLCKLMDRRMLAAVGIVFGIGMQLLTPYATGAFVLCVMRFVAGLGIGLSGSIAVMCLSALPRPAIAVAVLSTLVVIEGTVLFLAEAPLRTNHPNVLFSLIAASAAIGLTLVRYLPYCSPTSERSMPLRSKAGLLLAAYGLFILSNATVWSFVEQIGSKLALSPSDINGALGLSTVTVFAGIAFYFVKGRATEAVMLTVAAVLLALSYGLLVKAHGWPVYALGLCVCTGAAALGNIAFLDLMARIDRSGRIASMSAGVCAIATACGPVLGGLSLHKGAFYGVAISGAIILVPAVLALFAGGFMIGRTSGAEFGKPA